MSGQAGCGLFGLTRGSQFARANAGGVHLTMLEGENQHLDRVQPLVEGDGTCAVGSIAASWKRAALRNPRLGWPVLGRATVS
jgi:hypothetical protein